MADEKTFETIALPGFRDFELIGTGGFSAVYKARQDLFDRAVAIKLLAFPVVDDHSRRVFLRECQIAGQLGGHPNVVTVLAAGFSPAGQAYIVFEYMANGSLAQQLERSGPLEVAEVVSIGTKLCDALEAMHREGLLHRDIKPSNVLRSRFGEPCLADFGISAAPRGLEGATVTTSLTTLYAAPEVIDGEPSTVASDVYSLGSTLYALLAGRAPHQAEGNEKLSRILQRIFHDSVAEIDRSDIPGELMSVLLRAMEKDPAARQRSAEELGLALRGVQRDLEAAAGRAPPAVTPEATAEGLQFVDDETRIRGRAPANPMTSTEADIGSVATDPSSATIIRLAPSTPDDETRQTAGLLSPQTDPVTSDPAHIQGSEGPTGSTDPYGDGPPLGRRRRSRRRQTVLVAAVLLVIVGVSSGVGLEVRNSGAHASALAHEAAKERAEAAQQAAAQQAQEAAKERAEAAQQAVAQQAQEAQDEANYQASLGQQAAQQQAVALAAEAAADDPVVNGVVQVLGVLSSATKSYFSTFKCGATGTTCAVEPDSVILAALTKFSTSAKAAVAAAAPLASADLNPWLSVFRKCVSDYQPWISATQAGVYSPAATLNPPGSTGATLESTLVSDCNSAFSNIPDPPALASGMSATIRAAEVPYYP
jgi:serine/threonine-protein kinase PknK